MGRAIKGIAGAVLILGTAFLASVGVWALLRDSRVLAPPPARAGEGDSVHRPDSFADAVDAVRPAVVSIDASAAGRRQAHRHADTSRPGHSLGAGLIVEADGHILTNEHVIGSAATVVVRTSDHGEYEARVIGRDPLTDLALLKVQSGRQFPVARLGDSDRLRVGDWVVAIGNPLGLEHTVTAGIVSAKGRTLGEGPDDDFIQTDTATHAGSSGGPLANTRGEVVGIHNIGFGDKGDGPEISLAIPINLVKAIVPQLKASGRVSRGWLGIKTRPVALRGGAQPGGPPRGALVTEVTRQGPAAVSGLRAGDLIAALDGTAIHHPDQLARLVARRPAGYEVQLTLRRGAESVGVRARLAELPVRWDRGHGHPRPVPGV
jgi:serine protease Do